MTIPLAVDSERLATVDAGQSFRDDDEVDRDLGS